MLDRAAWQKRQQQWREYHRWAATQPLREFRPEEAIADVAAMLEWIPESVRREERDPERCGVRRMHAILRLVSGA